MPLADLHQHVWTEPLLDRLAARRELPLVERSRGLTVLHCAGEQPYVIETEPPERRESQLRSAGLDLAVIAISSPVGLEALPRESALELIDAHLDGVAALAGPFAAWGPLPLDGAGPGDVDRVLARGCVGISLPAGALAGRDRLSVLDPVLERIAERDVPLFVHPGPGREATPLAEPLWWPALTGYVAQQQAAWLTLMTAGRRHHLSLKIVFAMLAGCAPLQHERLATRGGPAVDLRDPRVFYDTSSYGPVAVEAMARVVGESQLAYGSDRPVIEPLPTPLDAQLQAIAASVAA